MSADEDDQADQQHELADGLWWTPPLSWFDAADRLTAGLQAFYKVADVNFYVNEGLLLLLPLLIQTGLRLEREWGKPKNPKPVSVYVWQKEYVHTSKKCRWSHSSAICIVVDSSRAAEAYIATRRWAFWFYFCH